MFGFINLHKPPGVTSHTAVAAARRALKCKQIGHAGTLDPMATGVLPLGVGPACRLLRFLPGEKVYLADILLGTTTDTDDVCGRVLRQRQAPGDPAEAVAGLETLTGEIEQVPPAFSAVHVNGRRLYELARQGRAPENVPSRKVTIHGITVINYSQPVLTARISCSSGTYIRSIARDLGEMLGCGGCLSSLVRERSAGMMLENAISLEELGRLQSRALLDPACFLALPSLPVSREQVLTLQHGKILPLTEGEVQQLQSRPATTDNYVMALAGGALAAVCTFDSVRRTLRPAVVMPGKTVASSGRSRSISNEPLAGTAETGRTDHRQDSRGGEEPPPRCRTSSRGGGPCQSNH